MPPLCLSGKAWAEKAAAGVVGFDLTVVSSAIDTNLETQAGVLWDAAFGICLSSQSCVFTQKHLFV